MKVTVSFPHTNPQYIDVLSLVEAYTEDTKQDIIDRAIIKIENISNKRFNGIDGYKSSPATITLY